MAAEPLDLVGTWKSTGDHAAVMVGEESEHAPRYDEPAFGSSDVMWHLEITEQKERAFHGVSRSPKGGEEEIVGVISSDGERIIISSDEGGMFGTVMGDQIEFCFQDHFDDRAVVSCYVAAKE